MSAVSAVSTARGCMKGCLGAVAGDVGAIGGVVVVMEHERGVVVVSASSPLLSVVEAGPCWSGPAGGCAVSGSVC